MSQHVEASCQPSQLQGMGGGDEQDQTSSSLLSPRVKAPCLASCEQDAQSGVPTQPGNLGPGMCCLLHAHTQRECHHSHTPMHCFRVSMQDQHLWILAIQEANSRAFGSVADRNTKLTLGGSARWPAPRPPPSPCPAGSAPHQTLSRPPVSMAALLRLGSGLL